MLESSMARIGQNRQMAIFFDCGLPMRVLERNIELLT